MLEVFSFIFSLILEFLYMLFDIDIGFTSLGILMCVVFIFLPIVLKLVDFLKADSGDVSFALFAHDRGSKKGGKDK